MNKDYGVYKVKVAITGSINVTCGGPETAADIVDADYIKDTKQFVLDLLDSDGEMEIEDVEFKEQVTNRV